MALFLGLGQFSKLPPELRLQIWDCFSLQPVRAGIANTTSSPSRHPRLGILRTSHHIHDEIFTRLYRNVVLRFQILPEYDAQSLFVIASNIDASWNIQNIAQAFSQGFSDIPFEKLKGIQIEITAPSRRDPGQVVCLREKCRQLSQLLEPAKNGLPKFDIYLNDCDSGSWYVDGEPQKSIASDRPPSSPPGDEIIERNGQQTRIILSDCEIVLSAFFRLRNAQAPKVHLPEEYEDQGAFDTEEYLGRKAAFGTYLDSDDLWDDDCCQVQQDDIFMDLDLELDFLPGKTADMMRLERFSSWYSDGLGSESDYEQELQRGLKTDSSLNNAHKIQLRHFGMRAFNPESVLLRLASCEDGVYRTFPGCSDKRVIARAYFLGWISDGWNRDSWHRHYPDGIPPFYSQSFLGRLAKAGFEWPGAHTYLDEYAERLYGWAIKCPVGRLTSQRADPYAIFVRLFWRIQRSGIDTSGMSFEEYLSDQDGEELSTDSLLARFVGYSVQDISPCD